jgi:hypothetical protein
MPDQTLLDLPRAARIEPGLTATHLTQMLRRHYLPENRPVAGIFAPEIGSPDGKRRADLIWMPTTMAGGRGLHGHEIKVSRADLLTELDDPTKADPWARYCSRWWLVVAHPSLISGLDIPEVWGVMAPPSGRRTRSMTVVKPAPKLDPHEPGPGIARLAAWLLYGTSERVRQVEYDRDHHRCNAERLQAECDRLRLSGGGHATPHAEQVSRIVRAVSQRLGHERVWGDLNEEAVIAAIVDHTATVNAARSLRLRTQGVVDDVTRLLEPFRHTLKDLQKAEKLAADLTQPGAVA